MSLCWVLESGEGGVHERVGALQARGHHGNLKSPLQVLLQQSKGCARRPSWHGRVTQPPRGLDDLSLAGSGMLVPPPGATPKPHLPKLNPLRCLCPTCWQRRCPRTKTPGLVTPDHPRSMGSVTPGHFHLSPVPQTQRDGASELLRCSRRGI